jgi:uncharacterized protein
VQTIEGITLTNRDGQLVAACRPAADAPAVDLQTLRGLIEACGFGSWAPLPEALATLAARWRSEADGFEIALAQRQDARYAIEVADDGLSAWINLTAARGGQPPQLEDLLQALIAAGVVFGIDSAALEQACASSVDLRLVAASAVLPRKGDDTRFELLVADTRDRAPKVDERGLIDYRELGDIPVVEADQALMRRHPPTPGVDGCDVRGRVLRAAAGLNEGFAKPLLGAAVAADDANLLRALHTGQPVRSRNAVAVERVLRLKSVDMASGNIHFDGTVEVTGDVGPGMKVEASGDIIVKGLVEGAELDAGGSIRVFGGAIAHARLRSAHLASVRFCENASIDAGTGVVVEATALHSDLQALDQVLVGSEAGSRGRLVGGSTRATMLVRTPQLGAPSGGLTRVQVGINPVLEARGRELAAQIEQEQAEADKLQLVVQHLTTRGDPRGMLEKVRAAWQQALQQWGASLAEKADLERQLALTSGARIEVTASLSGDVDIAFGKVARHLRSGYPAGSFGVDEQGRVAFSQPDGTPVGLV